MIAAAITGASAGVASAEPNTGQGSAAASKQQACDALAGIVNTLGAIGGAMELGSPAQRAVQAVQQAIYDAASPACAA